MGSGKDVTRLNLHHGTYIHGVTHPELATYALEVVVWVQCLNSWSILQIYHRHKSCPTQKVDCIASALNLVKNSTIPIACLCSVLLKFGIFGIFGHGPSYRRIKLCVLFGGTDHKTMASLWWHILYFAVGRLIEGPNNMYILLHLILNRNTFCPNGPFHGYRRARYLVGA